MHICTRVHSCVRSLVRVCVISQHCVTKFVDKLAAIDVHVIIRSTSISHCLDICIDTQLSCCREEAFRKGYLEVCLLLSLALPLLSSGIGSGPEKLVQSPCWCVPANVLSDSRQQSDAVSLEHPVKLLILTGLLT